MENGNNIKEVVLEWVELDKNIKSIRKTAKEINQKKKNLEDVILKMMKDKNIEKMSLASGGTIKKNTTQKKKNLTKAQMNLEIIDFLENDDLSARLIDKLSTPTDVTLKEYLSFK